MPTQNFRKRESPYVNVDIQDRSRGVTTNTGTSIPVFGYAPQGPVEEPTSVSSYAEWREIFGIPETAAERYAAQAVKELTEDSPANVVFTRLAPGSGLGLGYSDHVNALVFPVIGVSAVEINPCDYYRNVDEANCRVNFPWLYTAHFVNSSICLGSANLNCPLASLDEDPGYLYLHDTPTQYDSILTGFKFVVDADADAEDLRIFQLRPTSSTYSTSYSIVTSINLSSIFVTKDENAANLSNDAKRLIVDLTNTVYARPYTVTAGLLSGQTISGIQLSAGDIFGTYSLAGGPVLKYFNANPGVANSYKTDLTTLSQLSAGRTFSVVNSAIDASTQDLLIQFCTVPVEAGLSCQTITSLGLQVPEKDKYNFYPLTGDATLNDANFYVLGQPISKQLNASEYDLFLNDQFTWKCGTFENVEPALDVVGNDVRAGIIVINEAKSAQLEDFSGYYLAVNDNLNVNPATDFDALTGVAGYYQEVCPGVSGNWIDVPADRWNFDISSTFSATNGGSISQIIEDSAGTDFGEAKYKDSLVVNLFRLRPTQLTDTINKLESRRVETFVGSLNANRKVHDQYGGPDRSFFLEPTVNNGSNFLKVKVNPYLATNNCWNDASGLPQKTVRMYREKTAEVFGNFQAEKALAAYGDKLYGLGSYSGFCRDAVYELCQKKDIGNLPAKLERALMLMENPSDFPIDITIDAGLSTIWATRYAVQADHCITDPSVCYNYDDSYYVDTSSLSPFDGTTMTSNILNGWQTIYNIFSNFGRYTRKDAGGTEHFHIQDPIRQIFVNGKDYKVVNRQKKLTLDPATGQPTDKYSTFSRNIWAYLKNNFSGAASPFTVTDGLWVKVYDSDSDQFLWVGPSAHLAALYARNDFKKYPWTAALGYENGAYNNVIDIAINPNQRERDLLSRININPVIKTDLGGYARWNTLTLQREESALKEDYIVRGAIWLAKSIQATLRSYIGQPNNIVTRTRVTSDLRVLAKYMQDNGGLESYDIICNENNNSAESIAQGVLNCAVVVRFTRTTKFINVDIIVDREQVGIKTSF